ncbi:MAG: zinc ribbon domain-containing protein [Promethearchaeota archaeon]
MSSKNDWTKYTYVLPLISFIIGIIALITPTGTVSGIYGSMGMVFDLWMWGFWSTNVFTGPGPATSEFFIEAYEVFIPSMICFAMIVISLIGILVLAMQEKRGEGHGITQIIFGIIIIISTIMYMIFVDMGFSQYYERLGGTFPMSFWSFLTEGFGIIGPIICGIISIIGGGVSKYIQKNPDIVEKIRSKSKNKSYIPQSSPTSRPANPQYNPANYANTQAGSSTVQKISVKFCPHCGAQQEEEGLFCGKCGGRF